MTDDGCGGHAGLTAELRALVVAALDRLGPVLDRVRTETAAAPTDGPDESRAGTAACAVCPVCAVVAALRGERPELAVRLAEQAAGLLQVVRETLAESRPAGPAPPESPAPEPGTAHRTPAGRQVHRIAVERVDRVDARR